MRNEDIPEFPEDGIVPIPGMAVFLVKTGDMLALTTATTNDMFLGKLSTP